MNHQSSLQSTSTSFIHFQGPYFRQLFSLPDSIIYYIAKNPSTAKVYQKLIQTCKYFFAKNPILILPCLHFTEDGWKTCLKKCKDSKEDFIKFDMEKLSQKLWILQIFELKMDPTIASPPSIISKIYQSNIIGCTLFRQSFTFDEFLFFASTVVNFNLRECSVKDSSGAEVKVEKIISSLPKIKNFSVNINPESSNISTNTVKELLKIPHFSLIKRLFLHQVSDIFDVKTIHEYLKTTEKNFRLYLGFREQLSDAYFNCLETIVDEMLETSKSFNYIFPYIFISNLNQNKRNELYQRYAETTDLW